MNGDLGWSRITGATFARRGTPLPPELPVGLTEEFARDRTKGTQWKAFVRKTGAADAGQLPDVVGQVARFVEPPLAAARGRGPVPKPWVPGGTWK